MKSLTWRLGPLGHLAQYLLMESVAESFQGQGITRLRPASALSRQDTTVDGPQLSA